MQNSLIVIIEGPSGVGKDTIINTLLARYPDRFGRPANACTRAMRENESQNNPYYFISEEEFFKLRESGDIFEHTMRHGTYRGMRKTAFDEILSAGKVALRDCDRYGLEAISKLYPNQVISIFLTCPKEEIRKRLINRNEPQDSMEARLKDYDDHVKQAVYFEHIIENIDLEETVSTILKIISEKEKSLKN
ncbi:MAG: hypothetical protein E7354_00980 [Clostridiales bacterium]|nr:hypothetical protein [Clostridiales bacterium]